MLLDPQASFAHLADRFGPTGRIGVALSGGPDSLVLLHALTAWRDAYAPEMYLHALTVDHGLREGSGAEAGAVARMAADMGVPHATLVWRGSKPTSRIQERARTARYDLMHDTALSLKLDCIVTGHTRDDQAETLLMRMQRGGGTDARAGIPRDGAWMDFAVHRPLLDVPRSAIDAYVKRHGLRPVRDPSNTDTTHERVRVRNALRRSPERADELIAAAQPFIRQREQEIAQARSVVERCVHFDGLGFAVVTLDALKEDNSVAARIFRALILRIGGGLYPPRRTALERLQRDLGDWAREGGKIRVAATLGGTSIETFGQGVVVTREPGRFAASDLPAIEVSRVYDRRFIVPPGPAVRALPRTSYQSLTVAERRSFPGASHLLTVFSRLGLPTHCLDEPNRARRLIARICCTMPVVDGDVGPEPAAFAAIAPRIGPHSLRIDGTMLTSGSDRA